MPRRHLIITGTGRAGTTLLVQLFTDLGFDTGFTNTTDYISSYARAGMEFLFLHPDSPYIIKSPVLCDMLDEWIVSTGVIVDHAIVPTRDLRAAAESRRRVTNITPESERSNGTVAGGLWNTSDPHQQEEALRSSLRNLELALAKHRIPTSRPEFPRLARDPVYLYEQIETQLHGISYAHFLESFERVVNTAWINEF